MASIIALVQQYVIYAGGLIAVIGIVMVGINLPQHNGPGIQNGFLTFVGGGLIIAVTALLGTAVGGL